MGRGARARAPPRTGFHSVLQVMTERGRSLGIAGADRRMCLKFGDGRRLTADDCAPMVGAVDQEMHTSRYTHRHAEVETEGGHDIPPDEKPGVCAGHTDPVRLQRAAIALGLAQAAYRLFERGVAVAYSFDPGMTLPLFSGPSRVQTQRHRCRRYDDGPPW